MNIKHLIPALLVLPGLAFGQGMTGNGGGMTGNTAPMQAAQQNSAGLRSAMAVDPIVSTLDSTANGNATVFGDAQEFDAVACYNGGNTSFCGGQAANIINFPSSGTVSTTASVPVASQTLTLGTNSWCSLNMSGQPLYIAGVTAPGTHLVGCPAGNLIVVDKPTVNTTALSSVTSTVQYGVNFQQSCPANPASSGVTGCVGSTLITTDWAMQQQAGGVPLTIIAVNSPTNITVSANGTNVEVATLGGYSLHFLVGHDDSAAVNAACYYAQANNLVLDVPVAHLVPSMGQQCLGVLLRGTGRLANGGDIVLNATTTVFPEPVVVPWNASAASPPRKSLVGRRDLPRTAAAGIAPSFAFGYDSQSGGEPDTMNDISTYPPMFTNEFRTQNPALFPVEHICGVGGGTMALFDGNPTGTNGPCITSTSTSWLSQINTNAAPSLLNISGGRNDGVGLSLSTIADVWKKSTLPTSVGGLMTTIPDVVVTAHHPQSRVTSVNTEDSLNWVSGLLVSFADVLHLPAFDVVSEVAKHNWGYDPRALKFERAYDAPFGSSNPLLFPFAYQRATRGIAATFKKTGQYGSAFWANFNGGVAGLFDSRGPFISMGISGAPGNKLWLFYLPGTNTIGLECDANGSLPGFGCQNPATGLPPTTPSLIGNITLTSPGSIANPAAPTVAMVGGSYGTQYTYAIVAVTAGSLTTGIGSQATVTNGKLALDGTHYVSISWSAISGATSYQVWRTGSGGSPSTVGLIGTTTSTSFNDTGLAATGTIAFANNTANTTITTSTGFGWPCTVGMTIAVPGAGTSDAPPGGFSYVEPWITTVSACTSNTSITATNVAPTLGTVASSFVMSGNPIINSGIVDGGDGSGNEYFHVEFKDDHLLIWWNGNTNFAYDGPVMRSRAQFNWGLASGGVKPAALTIAADPTNGETSTFQIARPVPNLTDMTDADIYGPSAGTPYNNAVGVGPSGGDGSDHPTDWFGEHILRPLYQAADFSLPNLAVGNVTSSAYAVPSCSITRVPVSNAATTTITLPSGCPVNSQIVIQDVGGNAGSNTITIAGAAGYTLSGAATITAAYGLRTVTYTGASTAVSN